MGQSWIKGHWKAVAIAGAVILLFMLFVIFGGSAVSPDLNYFPE